MGVPDAAKGLPSVVLARALGAPGWAALMAGPAAIVRHALPLLLRRQGGKGLGTTVGIALAWTPESILVGMTVCAIAQVMLRNFDRSVIPGAAAAILLPPVFGTGWLMVLCALGLFCVHRVRKLQDRPHQRQVWVTSGGEEVQRFEWYGEASADRENQVASHEVEAWQQSTIKGGQCGLR